LSEILKASAVAADFSSAPRFQRPTAANDFVRRSERRRQIILPFVLGLWLYYVPLGVPLGAITFVVLLSLFTFLRASKPKGWLFHRLDAASDGWSKYRRPIADEYESEGWITRDHS